MVASDHEFQFRRRLFEEVEDGFIFGEVAHFCNIAAVNEDITLWEGLTVSVLSIVAGERDDSMGVGDNAKAGIHCARRHFPVLNHIIDCLTFAKPMVGDLGGVSGLQIAIASRHCLGRSSLAFGRSCIPNNPSH